MKEISADDRFVSLEDDPKVMEAFEVLVGERPISPDRDKAEALHEAEAVLLAAMDQALSRRRSAALARLSPHQNTPNISHPEPELGTPLEVSTDDHDKCEMLPEPEDSRP